MVLDELPGLYGLKYDSATACGLLLYLCSYKLDSSATATISTNQIVRDVLISIQEREYTVDLIVLPGLAIDVILGMSWMSGHGVLIDMLKALVWFW